MDRCWRVPCMRVMLRSETLWRQLVMEGLFDVMIRVSTEFLVDYQLVILMFL